MASIVPETLGCISGNDEFRDIDESLLTSLLEESTDEGFSDERLHSIMQSLEAEINQNSMGIHVEDGDGCCLSNNLLLECPDMELAPSSPSEGMNFYMEAYRSEMDSLVEFNDDFNVYSEMLVESQGFSPLWQETCNTVIHG